MKREIARNKDRERKRETENVMKIYKGTRKRMNAT